MHATALFIACLLGAGTCNAGPSNLGGGRVTYSVAPTSAAARLSQAVNYGNTSSSNLGRESGGYASGGSGTGGNY
jgi:hypothetical protein